MKSHSEMVVEEYMKEVDSSYESIASAIERHDYFSAHNKARQLKAQLDDLIRVLGDVGGELW